MKKILIVSTLLLGLAINANAQQENCGGKGRLHSWNYVEAQGGLQMTATDAPMDKLLTPTVSLSFGHYFTPAVGARIGVNAWQSKSGFDEKTLAPWVPDVYYKWKYITPSVDLLLNLSNILDPKNHDQLMNVIFVGGVGVNYAWDNSELRALNLPFEQTPLTSLDECRLSHNVRAGLRVETRQSWPFGVSLEVAANNVEDRFNAKFNDNSDWQFTAQLGLLWRFGQKYRQCQKQVEQPKPVVPAAPVKEPAPVVEQQPQQVKQPVAPVEPQTNAQAVADRLNETIYYQLRESDPKGNDDVMRRVAEYMQRNPKSQVLVVGYADRETGNPRINAVYARKRAQRAKAMLVKQYGCDTRRIKASSKGDTEQPFSESAKNRCAIITSEGK
jgi:outer membrane protein OmpA-like peptidoglycan-associated protein